MNVTAETRPGTASPFGPADALDVPATVAFLEQQRQRLRQGLAAREGCLSDVLDGHEDSHEGWLLLIRQAQRALGPRVAQRLASLYGLHGRIVGSLERGLVPRLDPSVAAKVKQAYGSRLDACTRDVIEVLEAVEACTDPVASG